MNLKVGDVVRRKVGADDMTGVLNKGDTGVVVRMIKLGFGWRAEIRYFNGTIRSIDDCYFDERLEILKSSETG